MLFCRLKKIDQALVNIAWTWLSRCRKLSHSFFIFTKDTSPYDRLQQISLPVMHQTGSVIQTNAVKASLLMFCHHLIIVMISSTRLSIEQSPDGKRNRKTFWKMGRDFFSVSYFTHFVFSFFIDFYKKQHVPAKQSNIPSTIFFSIFSLKNTLPATADPIMDPPVIMGYKTVAGRFLAPISCSK